jgi:alpha-ketoglutarate-dependent taurine dioxygenase
MRIANTIQRAGFAFLDQFKPSWPTTKVAAFLGRATALPNVPDVHHLVPKSVAAATPSSYSGNYGLGQFPLHTDLAHWARPPRYLLLRCVVGSPNVATQLLDGQSLIDTIGHDQLWRALVRPRRPLSGRRELLRLLEQGSDGALLRWDFLYIRPASEYSKAVYDGVVQFLRMASPEGHYLRQPGDTVIVDNWRMLHGRSSITANSQTRIIERMYLGDVK